MKGGAKVARSPEIALVGRRLRAKAVVLHPGPYNRGVELTDEALADPRSRYEAQVRNGVFVRMATLDFLVNSATVVA